MRIIRYLKPSSRYCYFSKVLFFFFCYFLMHRPGNKDLAVLWLSVTVQSANSLLHSMIPWLNTERFNMFILVIFLHLLSEMIKTTEEHAAHSGLCKMLSTRHLFAKDSSFEKLEYVLKSICSWASDGLKWSYFVLFGSAWPWVCNLFKLPYCNSVTVSLGNHENLISIVY